MDTKFIKWQLNNCGQKLNKWWKICYVIIKNIYNINLARNVKEYYNYTRNLINKYWI